MSFFALLVFLVKPLDPVKRAVQDFSFTDIYYEIQKEVALPDTCRFITIVDMTKLTRRTDLASLLRNVSALNPKVVGLDVCFDNEGEDIAGNDSLIQVAEQYKNIVYSLKMLDWHNDSIGWTKAIHSFFYEITDITEGTTNMPRSLYDSMKRRVPLCERYMGRDYPSFVAQVANMYAERDVVKGRTTDVDINFSPTYFRVLQPEQVLSNPRYIEDQIVLIGAMYEDVDMHWTPVGKIAGVELLAYGLQSIVNSKEIKDPPLVLLCIISLMFVILVEVIQQLYIDKTAKAKSIFVRYIIGSTYIMSFFTFIFTSIVLGICYVLFKMFELSFNLGWSMSVIAFLGISRNMYRALFDYITAWVEIRHNKKNTI